MNSCVMVQAGNSGHMCQPSTPDYTASLSKASAEQAPQSPLTHICEQMQAYDGQREHCICPSAFPFNAVIYFSSLLHCRGKYHTFDALRLQQLIQGAADYM